MTSYYTRLQRKQDRFTKQRTFLLLAGSAALLVLFLIFGIPLLFSLTSRIIGLRGSSEGNSVSKGLAPNPPKFTYEYEATPSAQITLKGTADPQVTVEVFQNGRTLGTTVSDEDGKFGLDVSLVEGANDFIAVAINSEDQKSEQSSPYSLRFLTSEPKLELSVNDGDIFKESPATIGGKTDPGNQVLVNDHRAIVASDGTFTYNLSLSNGENKVKFVALDPAGNKTEKEITLKYEP